jgi:outer membrane protein OmpA-like peptidoglycan-associated protein
MRYRMLRLNFSRALCASLLVGAGCLFAVPASAQQEMYPGEDVIVNPVPGSGVLLYPGGKYGRVVRPLLQPGAPFPGTNEAPIHLHMPYKHVAHRVKKAPAAPPTAVATATPPAATPPPATTTTDQPPPPETANDIPTFETTRPQPAPQKPAAAPKPAMAKPAVAHVVKPAPATQIEQYAASLPAQAPKPTMPSGFKPAVAQASRPAPAFVPQAASAAPPKPAAAQPKPVVAQAAKPQPPAASGTAATVPFSLAPEPSLAPAPQQPQQQTRVASNQPPPAHTPPATPLSSDQGANGLVRQSQILFGPGAPDPVPEAIDAIKGLASPLNSALASGAAKIEVVAYGGAKGDKSSDARRLSLKRAIIIRQLLIDGGVPSDRIDVHAMGGTTDNEPTDRVDIFTKA